MEAPTFTPLNIDRINNMDTIISRGISTVPLTLNFPAISTTTATGAITTTEITTTAEVVDTQSQTVAMATNEISTTTISAEDINTVAMATTEISATSTSEEILEDNILKYIKETPTFNRIHAMVSVVGGWIKTIRFSSLCHALKLPKH